MTERLSETSAIGVGMGGSCPDCNAPVDLGQEFCLECGAPIRARSGLRRKQKQQVAAANPAAAAAALAVPGGKRGFPWVPFLVVLALAVVGIVFAMLSTDENKKAASEEARTDTGGNTTLSTAEPGSTQTVTTPGCTPGVTTTPGATTFGTTPALTTPDASAAGTPGLATTPATTPTFSTPTATTPGATGTGSPTVTVNERGELCGSSAGGTPATTPTDGSVVPTTPTTPTTFGSDGSTVPTTPGGTTTPTTTGSSTGAADDGTASVLEWPEDKSGYTVVLASFSQKNYTKADAQIRAAQAQKAGLDSGVIDSRDYSNLTANIWVVFSGIYDTESQAESHLTTVRAKGYQGAYVRQVKP